MPVPNPQDSPQRLWQQSLAECLAALHTQAEGLDDREAATRLARVGPNLLRPRAERALLLEFLAHFRNPLVLVLLGASAIAGFLGDVRSFVVISAIVLMSVTLDFMQEYRAGRAAERLKRQVALRATVVRGGQAREVAVADLVPGDVVLLAAGDLVPADGRVLEARDLFVNQSLLTGESYPVEKHAADIGPDQGPGGDIAAATNGVFMGTSIISGSARVVLARTGPDTALGQIAGTLARRPPSTAFERGTQAFGNLILRLTLLLVLFVLLVNALFHRPLLESFLFAVALAVGLTPELLPMVVSVTLSQGAMRLARRRVIVKRLSAVQDLGGIDVLCTDKTGTLTEGRIRLERHVDAAVKLEVFRADAALFHTGWFIESIATQVLVIFIIRTRGSPLASRPNVWLVVLSLAVVAAAAWLPWLPFAGHLGFVTPPPAFYGVLAGIVAAYLGVVFWAKQDFYRRWERRHP